MVKEKVCIGKGYARFGQRIIITRKKPKGALFRQRTKYFTRYVRGNENVFVPKKGVKLKKC